MLDYKINRKQFFIIAIVLGMIAFFIRKTSGDIQTFYLSYSLLAIIQIYVAKLRCNHINTTRNTFILVSIGILIPIITLASFGYLLFKKGEEENEAT